MNELKKIWLQHYSDAGHTLENMSRLDGVASVFNANIDAVLKVSPEKLITWLNDSALTPQDIESADAGRISGKEQLFKGLLDCFARGAAQEWLVDDEEVYSWMKDTLGYDHLQMGGQGGIIANVMAVTGVQQVYVHGAALPKDQTRLFLHRDNLKTADEKGNLVQASLAARDEDSLIHWILEFDKGAVFSWKGIELTCPKSNRFIATYDPLNFKLHIDPGFDQAMIQASNPLSLILLSGYQMLSETLPGGGKGVDRIEDSWHQIEAWKKSHPGAIVHFEFASTQDPIIRSALAKNLAPRADSVGLNEQETIQVLEVIGEAELAKECQGDLHSVNLFRGTLALFKKLDLTRVQLHMFGLYLTLVRPTAADQLIAQRTGMALAATIAAAKAGTGSIEKEENLLWAHGQETADLALKELQDLADYLEKNEGLKDIAQSGIGSNASFGIAVLPTILIDKPVTLVGMGDTISSLSLAGALVS